jgi:hypothetical protein
VGARGDLSSPRRGTGVPGLAPESQGRYVSPGEIR